MPIERLCAKVRSGRKTIPAGHWSDVDFLLPSIGNANLLGKSPALHCRALRFLGRKIDFFLLRIGVSISATNQHQARSTQKIGTVIQHHRHPGAIPAPTWPVTEISRAQMTRSACACSSTPCPGCTAMRRSWRMLERFVISSTGQRWGCR